MSGTLQFRHLCLPKTPSDYPGHWVGVNHLDGTNYLGILKRKTEEHSLSGRLLPVARPSRTSIALIPSVCPGHIWTWESKSPYHDRDGRLRSCGWRIVISPMIP